MSKIRVGIFFGGASREREVSFAGGRTVYDNLDKELFEAIPIFVDEFGNMIQLQWPYVYRGTLRDFYPPVSHLPDSPNAFQIYGESLEYDRSQRLSMLSELGKPIANEKLETLIDVAFLALHGEKGEDGTIQGLLEWYGIPYTGSGILPSSFGVNKAIQKEWMSGMGFAGPKHVHFRKDEWDRDSNSVYSEVIQKVGFPMAVKAANQGSSIGIILLREEDRSAFDLAVEKAFFRTSLSKDEWNALDQVSYIRELTDIRSGLGFPLFVDGEIVYHPENALTRISEILEGSESVSLEAYKGEVEIVIESMLSGKEFSCIVIKDEHGQPLALPPTEIVKKQDLYDYRSKYLPGLSRKITPIELPDAAVRDIIAECERLFSTFKFNTYARIDGFYTEDGKIYLNDPNTTSGMMPSSFFFHQAAEIGLNPSQFLTYILTTSLEERVRTVPSMHKAKSVHDRLDALMSGKAKHQKEKTKVAIILGGYSTERHISVESGRNIFEKLSSSVEYQPIPIFLTGSNEQHELYRIPVNVLLKDNADDIAGKVRNYHRAAILDEIVERAQGVTGMFADGQGIFAPERITYAELASEVDAVFIALHGRPGEDGAVQKHLDALGVPYNGSGVDSSEMTINKFKTNNLLREHGIKVADNYLVERSAWEADRNAVVAHVNKMGYPIIAKPSDEGCSSAVVKIDDAKELEVYAELTFRNTPEPSGDLLSELGLSVQDEFPDKGDFLVEKFIAKGDAKHFLEITGGMLTHINDGEVLYEVFEPSEALSEGEVLSLAEKFLAGEGQNITPARFSPNGDSNARISSKVRSELEKVARLLNIEGYCRIDAFVRIFDNDETEVIIIEINSLPGMTPATCIYHQASINGYKPFNFIDGILKFGIERKSVSQ